MKKAPAFPSSTQGSNEKKDTKVNLSLSKSNSKNKSFSTAFCTQNIRDFELVSKDIASPKNEENFKVTRHPIFLISLQTQTQY